MRMLGIVDRHRLDGVGIQIIEVAVVDAEAGVVLEGIAVVR